MWAPNGWGISGGQYGEFTCGTCHTPRAINIKGVTSSVLAPSGSFPGSTVIFQNTTTLGGFGDDTTTHTSSNKICEVCHTLTSYHKYNQSAVALHESSVGIYDCTECHPHNKGFKPIGGCSICHSLPLGNRVAVMSQFSGNSHHIQGVAVTDQQCYQCHWEANSDGSVNTTYHPGTSGAPVQLVIYGNGTRPTTYISDTTAVQYTANGTRAQIQNINQHCLSCHNAQNSITQPFGDGKTPNQYAWDGTSINARYSQTGTTTWGKYTTVTNASKKNIMKSYSAHGNAPNNYGGGWVTTPNGTGIDGTLNPTRGGASAVNVACFDCHMTQNAGTTPWGYQGTFGATKPIMGYFDTPYFGTGTFGPQQTYTYKSAAGVNKGGHLGASSSLTTSVNGTIGGLCTPCHDPHGVSPILSQQYAVPLLKGTWMTSPYKEDAAPSSTNVSVGGGRRGNGFNSASTPGYHIDQNTFNTNWNWSSTTRVTQTVNDFAGLCLNCHPKSSIGPGTSSTWKSVDRIHNTVKGWGTFGANANNKIHSFTCSKCHTPHNSPLNRLMVTNCLDYKHRGRVASGGNPAHHSDSGGRRGNGGQGSFPAGGQGNGTTYYFGSLACHDNTNSSGWPSNELWNIKTPW
jgi:hypothetical protein